MSFSFLYIWFFICIHKHFFLSSFLQSFYNKNAYIITQYPLTNTIHDFWRMVWEQNSLIVVNLTQDDERQEVCI